jgi:hypothetical protein
MYEPKKDIYTILSAIEGVTVYQVRPEIINTLPCITFYIGSNVPEYVLEKEIGLQDIDVIIDIWAETSKESGTLLSTLEQTMLDNDYRLIYNMDVPEDDLHHITTRFNLIR